jgi:GTPase Era involved in 16S rRNA processing
MTKCGYVSVVGRPNAGKSSLLNWLVGEKLQWFLIKPTQQEKDQILL